MAKTWAKILGVIVILVGIIGFFMNPLVGMMGYFQTNAALNVAYIVFGVILVFCGTEAKAKLWLKIIGVVYLVMAIFGFMTVPSLFGFMMVNAATNWLHVVLAIVMLIAGFCCGKKAPPTAAPTASTGGTTQM